MAKIRFGGGVAEIRGSAAGQTFSRNKGGAYMRSRVTPTNPQTAAQQAVRSRMTQLTAQWSNLLTQTQRDAWTQFGINFPTSDVFGEVVLLTGSQAYVRINTRLLSAGLTAIAAAPTNQSVTDLITSTGTFDIGAGNIEVEFTPTPVGANDHVQIFATPGLSPGVSYVKNLLSLIVTSSAAEAGPLNFETEWLAKYGTLPAVGQKVVVETRVIRSTNGAIDAPLRIDMTVVTT